MSGGEASNVPLWAFTLVRAAGVKVWNLDGSQLRLLAQPASNLDSLISGPLGHFRQPVERRLYGYFNRSSCAARIERLATTGVVIRRSP